MEKIKIWVTMAFSAALSALGVLAIPMLLLIMLNILDYATGIAAAKYRNEAISSDKGLRGIIKKLCTLLLVGIGAVMDWVLMFATATAGLTIPFTFVVATVVAVWLICNEIISVLENMLDIGVALPPFLEKLAKYIRRQAELEAYIDEGKDTK